MNWITRFGKLAGACALGLLAGCGGGGGAGGAGPYSITLRVDRALLPLNIANDGPNIGGRYTSTIYVDARDNAGRPIPGGADVFGCSVTGGLDTGALYYLDGDPEHETTETINNVEVTYPNAYRAITLDSNSGSASFHFHAGDTVGSVTIRCTVSEPTTNIQRSAQTTIQVGGASTGRVSQVVFDRFSPNYLYRQGLPAINGTTQVVAQVRVVDEAGQPVADAPAGANSVQIRIVPDPLTLADEDALLRGVNAAGTPISGQIIHARTINGQAQFTIVSGTNTGTLLIEALADRSDNNISNGATSPIVNYVAVPVVDSTSTGTGTAITIETDTLPVATANVSYGALLEASGGSVPYTWNLISAGLPDGLALLPSGVITGTPYAATGTRFSFVVQVTDSKGGTAQKNLSMAYTPPAAQTPTPTAPIITTDALSDATAGAPYAAVMTATGGTAPYTWTANGLPTGLTMTSAGVISGTPDVSTGGITYPIGFTVTSANGLSSSEVRQLQVIGGGGGGGVGTIPQVNWMIPADGQTNVSSTASVLVSFSQSMNALTVNQASILVRNATDNNVINIGTITANTESEFTIPLQDKVFNPACTGNQVCLAAGKTYQVTFTNSIRSAAGLQLAASTYTFTTAGGGVVDVTAPTVAYTLPNDGEVNIDPDAPLVSIKFSEGMDANTINDATFTVTRAGNFVPPFTLTKVADDLYTLAWATLADGATYTVTVTTAARDKSGNSLAAPYSFTFTTGLTGP